MATSPPMNRAQRRKIQKKQAKAPDVSTLLQQGLALHNQGLLERAEAAYRKVLAAHRNHPDALQLMGMIALAKQQIKEARTYFQTSLKVKDDQPHVWYNLGIIHYDEDRVEQALGAYDKALQYNPNHVDALFNKANVLADQACYDEALEAFDVLLKVMPEHITAIVHRAFVLKELGRADEAQASLAIATGTYSQAAELWQARATFERMAGQKTDALAHYRMALDCRPDHAETFYNIALLESDKAQLSQDLSVVDEALEQGNQSIDDQVYLQFAAVRLYESLEDKDQMMQRLQTANHLKRSTYSYSHEQVSTHFEQIRTSYDQMESLNNLDPLHVTPMFIVGMPRSGSTLVEQILTSHSQVGAGGELTALSDAIAAYAPDYPTKPIHEEELLNIREAYIKAIGDISDHPYVTDKMPMNFMHVGLIHQLFPEAVILHTTRDALDVCFSIYKRLFMAMHPYAYDQRELALYYNACQELMTFWQLKGIALVEQPYEELVSQGDEAMQKLVDACGLPWEDACSRFYEQDALVSTASVEQVRQPLYTDAIGAAQPFAHHLEPMIDILNQSK